MDRTVIFGASRGLGAELAKFVAGQGINVTGFARKEDRLKKISESFPFFEHHVADVSIEQNQERALNLLFELTNVTKIFCVVGGGPYGPFQKRAFKDHEWAWQVTYVFAARLVHAVLSRPAPRPQVILIGSSVAESAPDPMAASYCAAKHALFGLYKSLKAEAPDFDLRLFSPGYMDTELLPSNAAQRKLGVFDPAVLAQELWTWSLTADIGGHKVYPHHPKESL